MMAEFYRNQDGVLIGVVSDSDKLVSEFQAPDTMADTEFVMLVADIRNEE